MNDRLRLVLASSLMLFTELVLIRWAGANVVYLSYFSNFVLLGSFLGVGLGFLRARSRTDLLRWAPLAMALFVAFIVIFPVVIDRSGTSVIYFGALRSRGMPVWVMLPIIFCAVATIMACIAQGVAKLFVRFAPLDAYRLDILGSLAGIAIFTALSFFGTGPIVWGSVIAVSFVLLRPPRGNGVGVAGCVALVALFALGGVQEAATWSPYYRVQTFPLQAEGSPRIAVTVNGVPHQLMMPVEDRVRLEPIYGLPYVRATTAPRRVLIVGAGTGSDVAVALREGAEHVDAVEIDGTLQRLGRDLHPDRPYQDPRVDAIVDDGRAFLERTDRAYDLILFALPDSLTLVSGQSSLRLESYLFTREAFAAARAHLAPGGAFGMYNYYREPWLVDRLAGTLEGVFGRPPCLDSLALTGDIGHFSLLMVGEDPGSVACPWSWAREDRAVPAPATDDHPFVYLRGRTIPSLYTIVLAFVLVASLLSVRAAGGPLRGMRRYLDLFFMGAAFLLLETKNVVQFALLFGSTWLVNALVFGGILLTVLLAVETARRVRIRRVGLLWTGLMVTIGLAWLVPASSLLSLAPGARFVAGVTLAFAPIFLANMVFSERFREVGDSTVAFGANLLGAMLGGALEYLSLLVGFRSLSLVAAVLYAAALLCSPRRGTAPDVSSWGREGTPQERVGAASVAAAHPPEAS